MYRISIILLFLIYTANLNAQVNNINEALSRMERTVSSAVFDNSQESFSMRDNYYLGRGVAAYILGRYRLYAENTALIEYLNLICSALAVYSAAPNWYNGYQVMVLDDPALNAFSTPGGHIFISRGLLELVSSEDMIAAVIAHELAHIQLQHGIAEIMNARFIQELENERERISQNILNETSQRLFAESISEIAQSLFNRGYSQLQEFEADNFAFLLLVSTGYNPGSLMELLRIMEREQGNRTGNLNTSHPLPAQRIANLERNMLSAGRFADNSSARRERFNGIMGRAAN
jgi:predicted Zn-dependent protease